VDQGNQVWHRRTLLALACLTCALVADVWVPTGQSTTRGAGTSQLQDFVDNLRIAENLIQPSRDLAFAILTNCGPAVEVGEGLRRVAPQIAVRALNSR